MVTNIKPLKFRKIRAKPWKPRLGPSKRPPPVRPRGPSYIPTPEIWPYKFPRPLGTAGRFTIWLDRHGVLQQGTLPEYAVFWALEKAYAAFSFQTSKLGGRLELGGAVADFIISEPVPYLIIRVQGEYFHYEQGEERKGKDLIQKEALHSKGYTVIDIDAEDALRDPRRYVNDALAGLDRSRAMGGS